MSSLTRGSLPARVYWRRRLVTVLLVLSVGFVLVRALVSDPTPAPGADGAVSPAGSSSQAPAVEDGSGLTPEKRAARRQARKDAAVPEPLPEPVGRCADADVVVSPVVDEAVAGAEVSVVLNLRTLSAPACTWRMSPAHLTVKITSGDDDIWSTRECPGQLDKQRLVVRSETSTTTSVTWNARRSEAECPGNTTWAEPGYYYVDASSLGGEPNDVQFELVDPAELSQPQVRANERAAREAARQERRTEARQERRAAARAERQDRQDRQDRSSQERRSAKGPQT